MFTSERGPFDLEFHGDRRFAARWGGMSRLGLNSASSQPGVSPPAPLALRATDERDQQLGALTGLLPADAGDAHRRVAGCHLG